MGNKDFSLFVDGNATVTDNENVNKEAVTETVTPPSATEDPATVPAATETVTEDPVTWGDQPTDTTPVTDVTTEWDSGEWSDMTTEWDDIEKGSDEPQDDEFMQMLWALSDSNEEQQAAVSTMQEEVKTLSDKKDELPDFAKEIVQSLETQLSTTQLELSKIQAANEILNREYTKQVSINAEYEFGSWNQSVVMNSVEKDPKMKQVLATFVKYNGDQNDDNKIRLIKGVKEWYEELTWVSLDAKQWDIANAMSSDWSDMATGNSKDESSLFV